MDTDPTQGTSGGYNKLTGLTEYKEIVTPPSKRTKENTSSPTTECGKTSNFQNRGRLVLRYFECFKIACKKKLSATAQKELDRGVDMVNDLLTEVCSENMIINGRYLELKESLEEKKKKVEFIIPGIKDTLSDNNPSEIATDNEQGTTSINKRRKRRRKKTTVETREQTTRSDTEESGRESSSEQAKAGSKKKKKRRC